MDIKWILLFLCTSTVFAGQKTLITLEGRLTLDVELPDTISEELLTQLKTQVLDIISNSTNIPTTCLHTEAQFSKGLNVSTTTAQYKLTIDSTSCRSTVKSIGQIKFTKISEIGADSFSVQPDISVLSDEFWNDPVNSILIFAACGVVILILFVTCVVLACRSSRHGSHPNTSSLASNKQLIPGYHPYGTDTMVMDIPGRSKRASQANVEPTTNTIERWVHSQLGKPKKRVSKTPSFNHDMTTDSGIVTTSPRRHRGPKDHPDDDTIESSEPRLAHYKKMDEDSNIGISLTQPNVVYAEINERPASQATDNPAYVEEPENTDSNQDEASTSVGENSNSH